MCKKVKSSSFLQHSVAMYEITMKKQSHTVKGVTRSDEPTAPLQLCSDFQIFMELSGFSSLSPLSSYRFSNKQKHTTCAVTRKRISMPSVNIVIILSLMCICGRNRRNQMCHFQGENLPVASHFKIIRLDQKALLIHSGETRSPQRFRKTTIHTVQCTTDRRITSNKQQKMPFL